MSEHNYCYGFYRFLVVLGRFVQPFFLLALRLVWGILFLLAGFHKFLTFEATVHFFEGIGVPYPTASVLLVATVEVVGGFALAIGFLSRLFALPLIITMIVALSTAHVEAVKGFWEQPDAIFQQPPVGFLVASLVVFCFGPGIFSIDAIVEKFSCRNKCDQY